MRFPCPWQEVASFHSPIEFRSFERWMTGQVSAGMARQVPVDRPSAGDAVCLEVWYLHIQSREIWRLVCSEPPFSGVFVRVAATDP